jgi:hypothetical protein
MRRTTLNRIVEWECEGKIQGIEARRRHRSNQGSSRPSATNAKPNGQ